MKKIKIELRGEIYEKLVQMAGKRNFAKFISRRIEEYQPDKPTLLDGEWKEFIEQKITRLEQAVFVNGPTMTAPQPGQREDSTEKLMPTLEEYENGGNTT